MTESKVIFQRQYIKDLSFENPMSILANEKSTVKFDITIQSNNIKEDIFEVLLVVKLRSVYLNRIAYLIDLEYAGIFVLNFSNESKEILLTKCAQLLFPYVRNIISILTINGGSLPIYLPHINFFSSNLCKSS